MSNPDREAIRDNVFDMESDLANLENTIIALVRSVGIIPNRPLFSAAHRDAGARFLDETGLADWSRVMRQKRTPASCGWQYSMSTTLGAPQ